MIECRPSAQRTRTEEECRDMIIVAKWGIAATGRFFRIIYSGELWLTRAQAQAAVCSGFNMIEPCTQAWCTKICFKML